MCFEMYRIHYNKKKSKKFKKFSANLVGGGVVLAKLVKSQLFEEKNLTLPLPISKCFLVFLLGT